MGCNNNIEFYPKFGEAKGALGCLINGYGTAFDQCELLFALFTQAGLAPNYVLGQIVLTAAQASAWLGTDPTQLSYAYNLLNNAGVPVQYVNSNTQLQLSHIWIKVAISGTTYIFDPSIKQYTTTSGVNITTATGYNRTTFMSQAESGATVDPGGTFVQNLNKTNITSDLQTYAQNLQDWIQTSAPNAPNAQLKDVIGGRVINQIFAPVRQTTQPYEAPGDVPLVWTAIPNSYRITVGIVIGSINQQFFGSDVQGERLTYFSDAIAGTSALTLDGNVIATIPNGQTQATLTVTHPYATGFANQTATVTLIPISATDGFYYVFGYAFGPMGPGRTDYSQNQLLQAQASGAAARSDALLGSQLALLTNSYSAEYSGLVNIASQLTASAACWQCILSANYWETQPLSSNLVGVANFNIPGIVINFVALNSASTPQPSALACGMFGSALEKLALEQISGYTSAFGGTMVDIANTNGTKLYKITPADQGTLLPLLSGFQANETSLFTSELSQGYNLLIPQAAPQNIGTTSGTGWGFVQAGSFGTILGDLTVSKGGGMCQYGNAWKGKTRPKDNCDCSHADPVNSRTGDFMYESSDITVGSQGFPYRLEFKTTYDSRLMLTNPVGLGLGWTHNLLTQLTQTYDLYRCMGSQRAVEAAVTIAELFVALDLLSDTTLPCDKLSVLLISANWWADQLSENAVLVSFPEGDVVFAKLADGTYSPQVGDNGTLDVAIGSDITYTTPQQIVYEFTYSAYGAATNLSTVTYPNGIVLSYGYSGPGGAVSSVANNLGRTLTLTYSGSFLSTVTDGNSRTVTYAVNTSTALLTSITDPMSNVTTFGYDSSNRLYQYFRPQNPSNAVVTNTYDALSRISSQLDIYGNERRFYFAGSRSEFLDPAGNNTVEYYDYLNNLIEDIDELGNITSYVRDSRGRLTLLTYPEGNTEARTYDNNNNVLSVTYGSKPGSGLANIVNSFTYDPTYNKIHTVIDGKLQTTTYNYDPETGNLLTVQRPAVTGVTPVTTMAYNAFGQVISSIDETGIQTQNNYAASTETLLSTVRNTNWRATIGGTITVGDILTITAHDSLLGGGEESVTYTVKTGDTLTKIAGGLAAAVNADNNLAAVGIVAYSNAAIVSLSAAKGDTTTFTESVSGGATETIVVAAGLKITNTFVYDSVGNVKSIKDALNNTTTFVYDKSRRLTTRTEAAPFSYVMMYGYDKNNNLTSFQRQTGNAMTPEQTYTITYTLSDNVHILTDPATNATTKTYDNFDRLWTVTDAQSKKTTYAYDQRSKLHTVTDSSNIISDTRTYTNNGLLYQLSDSRSNTTTYSYDGLDRANKTTYADASYEQISSYDANNNILTMLTRSGAVITNTFDPLNRLSTKAPQGQATVTYLYDLSGRLLSVTTPVVSGNPATGAFSFAYDTVGRLSQEESPDSKTVKYGLDKNSNVTKLTYPDGYYVTRVYDQLNRLTTIELDGATAAAIGITYDELSRRAVLTYGNGTTSTYTFQLNDDLTTLAEAFSGSSVTLTYGFNNVHQETSRAVTDGTYLWHPGIAGTTAYGVANTVNEYPTVGSAGYSYDGNGNLKSDGTWTYIYDTENHLLSANKTGVSASYVYDGLHRQIQKTVSSTSTRYYYAGWQRLADYSGSTLQTRYVYGTGVDEPLIEVSSAGVLTYIHGDRSGSIIATTSSTGAVVSQTAYGPYGEGLPPSGTNCGYKGQKFDSETNLYYSKYRYYSPTLGSFLQPDPIGYVLAFDSTLDTSTLNLFKYAANDPLNRVDINGLSPAKMGDPLKGFADKIATDLSGTSNPKDEYHKCLKNFLQHSMAGLLIGELGLPWQAAFALGDAVEGYELARNWLGSNGYLPFDNTPVAQYANQLAESLSSDTNLDLENDMKGWSVGNSMYKGQTSADGALNNLIQQALDQCKCKKK